ncbi:MAG: peptide chain release factor N(5)-glutamine methyltransferase [Acidithiobacillus sp.]|nr:peptide chain release factor N(5)-glutamine methyltransferase [Acidithiobacillus sp.]
MNHEPGAGAPRRLWLRWLVEALAAVTDDPAWEARVLLEEALSGDALGLWRAPESPLPDGAAQKLQTVLQRRLANEPLAYCLGHWDFWDLRLRVNSHVLIPRPDTETLVRWALSQLKTTAGPILDLGTGSGAIALAIAKACPDREVWAVDHSREALAVAQENAQVLGLPIQFCWSDWTEQLPPGLRFALVLANPPYLAEDDPHLPELCSEPRMALVAGKRGSEAYERILAGLPEHLLPGARLGLEHGAGQGEMLRALLAQHGWQEIFTQRDLAGRERISGGLWRHDHA